MRIAVNIAHADSGIVIPIVVVPEYRAHEIRDEMEAWLEKANTFGVHAGADVEGVIRIDSDIHNGFLRELSEREGSMILTEWQRPPNVQELIFGDMLDRIGSRSPVPQAAVRFSDQEINRIVLVTGKTDNTPGNSIDLQVAVDLATRLSMIRDQPLHVVAPPDLQLDKDEFPRETVWITVEPEIAQVAAHFEAGDLVILPGAVARRIIRSHDLKLVEVAETISIMIAAGPHRLTLTSVGVAQ